MKPLQRGENIVDREKNNISKTGKKRKNMREGRSRGQGKRRKKRTTVSATARSAAPLPSSSFPSFSSFRLASTVLQSE
jgi:hypothetical protein